MARRVGMVEPVEPVAEPVEPAESVVEPVEPDTKAKADKKKSN